ncbi:MAG: TRAP transporter small permease subunit [Helicobacter sp.]|nr:TRAP transporter small permease subunit [Helicobacteraceae bacterium]MDY3114103.1 TRAP transporter small permease subunit [Helicobacter sp.]
MFAVVVVSKIVAFLDKISIFSSKLSQIALWILAILIFSLSIALNFSFVSSKLDDFSLYCFAFMVLFAFGFCLKEDKHVRVDLLYANYSPRFKTLSFIFVNLFFILPFSLILVKYSFDFTLQSYKIAEASPNGRIPYYFIFKTFFILGFLLLALQSIAEVLKAALKLKEHKYKQINAIDEEVQHIKESMDLRV